MKKRQSWDEYFINIAELVSTRSTCDRANVGCVLVRDEGHRIIATGYNGSISGNPHCDEIGHVMRDGHCIATIHAEMNALLFCAKEGISAAGCSAYVTHFPCLDCAKSLIQAGIKKIVYKHDYKNDEYAIELFKKNHVNVIKIE